MIELTTFNAQELKAYIHSESFQNRRFLPISYHRAMSQLNNPRLQAEDILLVLARINNDLVGYAGVLPDVLYNGSAPIRFGWLSTLYVDPKHRGKGIAKQLILKTLETWQGKIASADYAPASKIVYDKTEQFLPHSLHGVRLYLKSALGDLLPPKHRFFEISKPALNVLDSMLNRLPSRSKIDVPSKLAFEYPFRISDDLAAFIQNHQQEESSRRNQEALNWIIEHPWIVKNYNESDRYHFSSEEEVFEQIPVVVKNEANNIKAFLFFTRRKNHLKLRYVYHDQCIDNVVWALKFHISKWQPALFTTFHSELADELLSTKTPGLHKKSMVRNYFISKILDEKIDAIKLQDGDGDVAFT